MEVRSAVCHAFELKMLTTLADAWDSVSVACSVRYCSCRARVRLSYPAKTSALPRGSWTAKRGFSMRMSVPRAMSTWAKQPRPCPVEGSTLYMGAMLMQEQRYYVVKA